MEYVLEIKKDTILIISVEILISVGVYNWSDSGLEQSKITSEYPVM